MIDKLINVFMNTDYIETMAMALGGAGIMELNFEPIYLAVDVDNASLGHAVRLTLAGSTHITSDELLEKLYSGILEKARKDTEKKLMKQYGYKGRKALYRNLDCVSIEEIENQLKIFPNHHNSIAGYSGIHGLDPFILPLDVSDEELGKTVRLAFTKCTSIYE